jgi:toxin ParE1/3/4
VSRIIYSRKARADFAAIWRWIAGASGEARANDIVERIERRISILENHAGIGPARPDIDTDARFLVAERWVILYSIENSRVRINRILDGASDIKNRL